jgi:hypothetical protein|tara:strand:+ start:255 stop:512 length:258 start_codon:yes stop_codon:yes gene_type:complete
MNMGGAWRNMVRVACYVSIDIYDWDKNDIKLMVRDIRCVETVVDFLRAYQNTFGVDMKDKIEWAFLADIEIREEYYASKEKEEEE